jgi:uncharacterized protein
VPLSPGDPVRVVMTKWGDRPHWEMDALYLGADDYGDWIGFPLGTHMSRPGMQVTTTNDQVGLVPAAGLPMGNAWLATFHGPGGVVWTYVDMTSVPVWDGAVVRAVDLDLDVIETLDHSALVDDEDEFEQHRVDYGYPADLVELATRTCDAVYAALQDRTPPFDGSAAPWLDALHRLLAR